LRSKDRGAVSQPDESRKCRHICLVTETYPPDVNGVAMTLARCAEGLRSLGNSISVIRPRRHLFDRSARKYDPTLVRSLPFPGYSGVRVGLPAGGSLLRCWTERRPDAVYVATEGPLGWSAVSAARRLRIPVFSGFHTNFHTFSEHYHIGWLSGLIYRYLIAFHNRTAGTFVATGDLRSDLEARGVKNVSVLGRGVDSRLFTPERRSAALRRAWRASDADLVALYVGRVAMEKNLALAIASYRAMQRLKPGIRFVIVGDGPERAPLQKSNPDLIFCGTHTGESLAERYASADIFLFPSETETFGNVTLEAMASGLAVVAYDYAAAHAHVTHGVTGILAPYGNSRAFVGAAVDLTRAEQSLPDLRRRARDHAVTVDWQHVVERFAALLLRRMDADGTDPVCEFIEARTAGRL